jgi:hypothetical protein
MINEPTAEFLEFTANKNLLRDAITAQAGSIPAAVLELVMNAIEAKCTVCRISINEYRITVEDDGIGFQSREEIEAAFREFGKSDERAQEEKRWARFQTGRGKAMNLGKTVYRTHTFRMSVDIKNTSGDLGFYLEQNLPDVAGCTVTVDFHQPLSAYNLSQTKQNIQHAVRYVDNTILLNDEQVNEAPLFINDWDTETNEAYIRFDSIGSYVDVYNLGVFVCSKYVHGTGGIAVSKQRLTLNGDRNEVMHDCPIFQKISETFSKRSTATFIKKKKFSTDDIERIFERYDSGSYRREEIDGIRMFEDTNGKKWSLKQLSNISQISLDSETSQMADVAMKLQPVVVLRRDFIKDAMNTRNDEDAIATLQRRISQVSNGKKPAFVKSNELYQSLPNQHEVIKEEDLEQHEQIALRILRKAFNHQFIAQVKPPNSWIDYSYRELNIGQSPAYEAWTDGSSYILYNRDHFQRKIKSISGWAQLLSTIAHEYAHGGDERTHNDDFYERFHETIDSFLKELYNVFATYVRELRNANLDIHTFLERDMKTLEG